MCMARGLTFGARGEKKQNVCQTKIRPENPEGPEGDFVLCDFGTRAAAAPSCLWVGPQAILEAALQAVCETAL